MKQCNVCLETKELSEFQALRPKKSGGFIYTARCKKCLARLAFESLKARPERYEERLRYLSERQSSKAKEKYKTLTCPVCEKEFKQEHGRQVNCSAACSEKKRRDKYNKKHKEKNKGLYTDYNRAHKLRKRNAEGSHTSKQWEAVKAQQDYTCLRCGKKEPEVTLTRDHVFPLIKGGTDDISNIQGLCHTCNCKKATGEVDYR